MTKLARLISSEEGMGIIGALPTRNNNPGDLRHSPHSQHTADAPNAIGKIDTLQHGWDDLERQLRIDAGRGWTLQHLVETYAPPNENNTARYLKFICDGLGVTSSCTVAMALTLS